MFPRLIAATAATCALLVGPALAGKSDDTLNVAFDRELESLDNYVNTAREGILISRMVPFSKSVFLLFVYSLSRTPILFSPITVFVHFGCVQWYHDTMLPNSVLASSPTFLSLFFSSHFLSVFSFFFLIPFQD